MRIRALMVIVLLVAACAGDSDVDEGGDEGAPTTPDATADADAARSSIATTPAGDGADPSGLASDAGLSGLPSDAGPSGPDSDAGPSSHDSDAGPSDPALPDPTFDNCAIPAADVIAQVQGAWSGSLHLEQNLLGAMKEKNLTADVILEQHSAPRRHLAAVGYLGDGWSVGSPDADPGEVTLAPLFAAGGNGTLVGANGFEADGPGNVLTIDDSCVEASDTVFAWRYEITYHVSDLVHRRLYAYAEDDAPLATLAAQEVYALIDGRLHLRATSTGTTADGEPVSYSMTGTLDRITR